MFRLSHPDTSYAINQSTFKDRKEAEAHIGVIRKFTKEWIAAGGMTQEEADQYIDSFKIEEIPNELQETVRDNADQKVSIP